MSNAILGGSAPTIPQYVADGISGSGDTRTLTFSGGAPPNDGSLALCTVIISDSTGFYYSNSGPTGHAYQRLLYWADASTGKARVTNGSGFDYVVVAGWSFVADANLD